MLLRKRKKEEKESETDVQPIVQPAELGTPVYGQEGYTTPYMPMQTTPKTTYPVQPQPQPQPMPVIQPSAETSPDVMPMVIPTVSESEQTTEIEQPEQTISENQQEKERL
jgi:hypothetical protein